MKWITLSILFFSASSILAQDEIRLEIKTSIDSIYMDNAFKVEYIIHNGSSDLLSAPEFSDFEILQGPSTMSSMSIINGARSANVSMSYYLQPKSAGTFTLDRLTIEHEGKRHTFPKHELVVLDNPDGIQQDPNTGKIFGAVRTKKRKTRKRYKI